MEERLKELRKTLNLNQSEFAEKLNLGQSTWAMIEVGKRALNDRHILLICSVFNVNEEWLRTGIGNMFNSISEEDEMGEILTDLLTDVDDSVYKFIKSMLRTYNKLDDKSKEVIRNSTDLFIAELKKEG